jgi:flagellar motor switch protein FliN/FliY
MAENTEKEQNNDVNNEEQQQAPESEQDNENVQVAANIADFEEMEESNIRDKSSSDKLDFLKDLQLSVYIELGRTQMQIKDILELERGYVIELDKLASEPVDIFVNNKKIAEGEVVVIDKHFGIRITNLNEATNRLKGLY